MAWQGQAGAAEPGASPAGEFQAVVQRTQVLLLGGERWEPGRAQAALGSLAPSPAPPAGQLIFFLCRAPSLRGRGERLREVLRGVREQSRGAPTALLAVLVQPAPEEEAEARSRLDELLREAFPPPGPEVHTAVFRPGRPRGALELRPAAEAPREQPAAWIPRLLLLTSLLALPAPGLALEIHNGNIFKGPTHILRNIHPRDLMAALPRDCSEITWNRVSGVFVIQPAGLHQIVVYCDLNSTSEGWTVLQRNRLNTQLTWAESWSTYKYGFGNVHSDYWLGMEYIYQIAKQKVYQVRFIIHDSSGTMKYADYNLFSLEDESKGYRLRLGSYTGTAGDAMTSNSANAVHDNMKFSTKDLDQDTYSGNCASSYGGGWWYSACYSARMNVKGSITWGSFCSGNCQASAILIKPASYC